MSTREPRYKNWVFTLNNYSSINEEKLTKCIDDGVFSYLVYGYEQGKNGTPHLQGYFEMPTARTLNATKKFVGIRVHLEPRRGTQEQAIDYVKKTDTKISDTIVELGKPVAQGKRTDLQEIISQVKQGADMKYLLENSCSNMQHIKMSEVALRHFAPKRTEMTEIIWLFGHTGLGKSHFGRDWAYDRGFTEDDVFSKGDSSKWLEGYESQKIVIFDDFRGSWMKLSELLTLCDKWERRVEIKCGSRQFVAKYVIINSPYPPHACYRTTSDHSENMLQLLRRCHTIIYFDNATEVRGGNTDPPDPNGPPPRKLNIYKSGGKWLIGTQETFLATEFKTSLREEIDIE